MDQMFEPASVVQGAVLIAIFAAMAGAQELLDARRFPRVPGWRWECLGFTSLLFFSYVIVPTALAWAVPSGWTLFGLDWLGLWGVPVGIIALSFAEYWFHRAEHRFAWMWRTMHQIHHYPQRVDMYGTAHGHPLEMLVQAALSTGVMVFLLGLDPAAAAIGGTVLTVLGLFQHMDIRTPRWLGYLIARPDAHFLHHERGVHARNYSELPFWDMLFGTFENPQRFTGEVGFAGDPRARLGEMLLWTDLEAAAPPTAADAGPRTGPSAAGARG